MRRNAIVASTFLGAVALTMSTSMAQVAFTTQADWGGSAYSTDTLGGWSGWGDRGNGTSDGGITFFPSTSNGEALTFPATSLDSSTTNGVGDFNNNFDGSNNNVDGGVAPPTDTAVGTSYAGQTGTPGEMVVNGYMGGYDTILSGDEFEGTAHTAFANALTQNGADKGILEISYTSPLGGITQSQNGSAFFSIGFGLYANHAFPPAGAGNDNDGVANPFDGYNSPSNAAPSGNPSNVAAGSYTVINTSATGQQYFTSYIPYNLNPANLANFSYTYGQMYIVLNSSSDYAGATNDIQIDDLAFLPLPEPTSLGLVGLAASGFMLRRRRIA